MPTSFLCVSDPLFVRIYYSLYNLCWQGISESQHASFTTKREITSSKFWNYILIVTIHSYLVEGGRDREDTLTLQLHSIINSNKT